MSTQTITCTRALSLLKSLDERINRNLHTLVPVGTEGALQKPTIDKDVTRSEYQSLMDLMQQRNKLKTALIVSNATTMVTIAGETMTRADAITRKTTLLPNLISLRDKLKSEYANALNRVETANKQIRTTLENSTEKGKNVEAEKAFYELRELKLCDPLDIQKKLDDLNELIDKFTTDVDEALTVSNATTTVTF